MDVRVENEPHVRIIPITETDDDIFASKPLATVKEETLTAGSFTSSELLPTEQLWDNLCAASSVYLEFMTKLIKIVQNTDMNECKIFIGSKSARIGMYP